MTNKERKMKIEIKRNNSTTLKQSVTIQIQLNPVVRDLNCCVVYSGSYTSLLVHGTSKNIPQDLSLRKN